ncbi:unnamed protein product [Sympodiomycopsis kandeliae]
MSKQEGITEFYQANGQTIYRSNVKVPPIPNQSVWDFVLKDVKLDDNLLAFKTCDNGQELTYGTLKREALRLGVGLRDIVKLQTNEVILIFLPNTLQFPVVFFASIFAGFRVSFANPMYNPTELKHIIGTLHPKKIFTISALLDNILKAGFPAEHIVLTDTDKPSQKSVQHIESFKVSIEKAQSSKPYQPNDVNDTITLPWSSGTTGLPKAIEITHRNMVSMCCAIITLPTYQTGEQVLMALPFFHAIGLMGGIVFPLRNRGSIFLHSPFNPTKFVQLVKEHKITTLSTVPPMLKAISEVPEATPEHFASLRWIGCGAAPLDSKLQMKIAAKLKKPVIQGHGQTETTIAAFGLNLTQNPGTVGYIIPNVEARLVDDEDRDVKIGERGEILLKGPNITKGYYQNPEANESTFTRDGWLRTGDVGVFDKDLQLSIVDRKKELIKVKGFQVAPAELEGILLQHPLIAAAAVIGVYSEKQATEFPRAYIQLRSKQQGIEEEVTKWFNSQVSNFKQLRGGVKVIDQVPMNPSGKILRKEVRKLVELEQNDNERQSKL